MKFTGLVLWVADATLSYKFYKKLGFDIGDINERHAAVSCGNLELTLVTMRDDNEFNKDSLSGKKGEGLYVYLNVDDVDKKYQEIIKLGLEPSSEPRDWDWGNREFVIKDPDGYKLCFWQKL